MEREADPLVLFNRVSAARLLARAQTRWHEGSTDRFFLLRSTPRASLLQHASYTTSLGLVLLIADLCLLSTVGGTEGNQVLCWHIFQFLLGRIVGLGRLFCSSSNYSALPCLRVQEG